jgi:hypothetical protein
MSELEYAMPSSGDPEQDRKQLDRFALSCDRMEHNICPNNCGAMEWDDPHNRHCPKCGFAGFSTTPYDMIGGKA